mmetsp:Transcript_5795/g.14375  ORF Transcript_5795/g.14375 Transcript_5795/m.14375 type:complete len:281 (-) Transcript_5795:189-1031(-)
MLHVSRCRIIMGPTPTYAPHPLGHRRGCLRQLARCAGRRPALPRHRHPEVANGQLVTRMVHVARWRGMSRVMHVKPHTPPPPSAPSSADVPPCAALFPGGLLSSSSPSSSHRSHIKLRNSHVTSCVSSSRSRTAALHAVWSKPSSRMKSSSPPLPCFDADAPPSDPSSSSTWRKPSALRQKTRRSPSWTPLTLSSVKSSGLALALHEKHFPVCLLTFSTQVAHREWPQGAMRGATKTSSHTGQISPGGTSSTNTTRSRFVLWKNTASVPRMPNSLNTICA